MKEKSFTFMLFLSITCIAQSNVERKVESVTTSRVSFTVKTHNQPASDSTDCTQYFGQKLFACMACQSRENFKKNFAKISARDRDCYLRRLDPIEREEFLSNYEEEEWQEFFDSLGAHEQECLSKILGYSGS